MSNQNNNRPRPPPNHQTPENHAQRPNQPRPQNNSSNGNQYRSSNTKPFLPVTYTKEEELRIQRKLNKILGPEYVSFRPGGGGQNVSYIEGWKALNLANEIFGFNGWSSELISVQVDFMDLHGSGRVSLGLSVVVRITIKDGTFHEDFGYGFIENAKNKAMAFEKCKKEAFTDGLKRCLRCFGNVLGNCLYDKTIIAKMQKVKLPPSELEHDDFYRDPLVVKRERELQMKTRAQAAPVVQDPQVAQNGNNHQVQQNHQNPQSRPNGIASTAQNETPSKQAAEPKPVKYDLADFDDLFQFSDDMPGEDGELNDRLDDYELELLSGRGKEDEVANPAAAPTPSQVFFTSSKKALEVQQTADQLNVPQYDHKFVSKSVRRTVDPSKSAKVRRNDVPTVYTPSQMNRKSSTPAVPMSPPLGKRPLGMPPSQRPASKRIHKENGEKENENGAAVEN